MRSTRYRSQLFNAFSRQSRRLSDRVAQTWRQAKLTATWGTQILLYPIYTLYQGTRVVSRQIGQTVQRLLPQLQPAAIDDPANPPIDELTDLDAPVDTPILRSIAALAGLELTGLTPILPAADGVLAPAPIAPIVVVELPGVLSQPEHSDISPQAETSLETATVRVRGIASRLDDRRLVLTTMHNQLLDILTAEQQLQLQQRIIWELASYRRLLHLRSSASRPLPPPADSPHLLPPVRLLRRLVAWMQTSPVAIAANLFGEADLPALPPAPPEVPLPRSIAPSRFAWFTNWLDRAPRPTKPSAALPSAAPVSLHPWQQRLQQLFRGLAPQPGRSQPSGLVLSETADLVAPSPQPPAEPKVRWWRRKRLASGATAQSPIPASGRDRNALPAFGRNRQLAKTDRSTVTASGNPWTENDRLDDAGALALETETTTPVTAPTWIETDATLVGYVKHPLEQLLEWLDAGMLWLETTVSKLLRWLKGSN